MKSYILLTVLALLFVNGCCSNSSLPVQKTNSVEKETSLTEIREIFLKPKKEKLELLAIKYKINPEKIEIIIKTYLKDHDDLSAIFGQSENKTADSENKSILETIKYLEKEQNIPSEILASIIIDFQMWDSIEIFNNSP